MSFSQQEEERIQASLKRQDISHPRHQDNEDNGQEATGDQGPTRCHRQFSHVLLCNLYYSLRTSSMIKDTEKLPTAISPSSSAKSSPLRPLKSKLANHLIMMCSDNALCFRSPVRHRARLVSLAYQYSFTIQFTYQFLIFQDQNQVHDL